MTKKKRGLRKAAYTRLPVHIQLQNWVEQNTGLVLRLMREGGETAPEDRYAVAADYLRSWEPNLEKALFLWFLGERPSTVYGTEDLSDLRPLN